MTKIRVGAKISEATPENGEKINIGLRSAEVIYIHPQGKYYTVRFTYAKGSFTETRTPTKQELDEMREAGIVSRPESTDVELYLRQLASALKDIPDID